MSKKIILEACVETFEEAVKAEKNGANRIELCAALNVGGTTPSYALLESVLKKISIPVMVMIRPRGGDFMYDSVELKIMKQSIEICKSLDVKGVVFGILDDKNDINLKHTTQLAEFASPLEVTFHKAIDDCTHLIKAVRSLKRIEAITRILTSGGMVTALEGGRHINEMIIEAEHNLKILAAGQITAKNLNEVSEILHTDEFHGRKIVGNLT